MAKRHFTISRDVVDGPRDPGKTRTGGGEMNEMVLRECPFCGSKGKEVCYERVGCSQTDSRLCAIANIGVTLELWNRRVLNADTVTPEEALRQNRLHDELFKAIAGRCFNDNAARLAVKDIIDALAKQSCLNCQDTNCPQWHYVRKGCTEWKGAE